jgi:hypothetical protein
MELEDDYTYCESEIKGACPICGSRETYQIEWDVTGCESCGHIFGYCDEEVYIE